MRKAAVYITFENQDLKPCDTENNITISMPQYITRTKTCIN